MIASWGIEKHVKGYCMLFLILETGVLGTFFALDFFLFYIFWEVMLLPMYFLIGIWGGPRREYAAIKFFLYTLFGSVFILIALLGFYFTDVQDFAQGDRRHGQGIGNVATFGAARGARRSGSEKGRESGQDFQSRGIASGQNRTASILVILAKVGKAAMQWPCSVRLRLE